MKKLLINKTENNKIQVKTVLNDQEFYIRENDAIFKTLNMEKLEEVFRYMKND